MHQIEISLKDKPTILVTNDDGIPAPGLHTLVDSMRRIGNVIVVAPDGPQSGMGHAITVDKPLRLDRVNFHSHTEYYQSSGTPADCVKLAVDQVLHNKPDLVVSGINHGTNSSINVLYSGTLSAAMEGAIQGIPSIGFSLTNFDINADMSAAGEIAYRAAIKFIDSGLPHKTLLNVNIPDLPLEKIKGMKVCRQAMAKYEEEFEQRTDPRGRKYYWLTGNFVNYDGKEDTDEWALANGYVSVVPVKFDLTAYNSLEILLNKGF